MWSAIMLILPSENECPLLSAVLKLHWSTPERDGYNIHALPLVPPLSHGDPVKDVEVCYPVIILWVLSRTDAPSDKKLDVICALWLLFPDASPLCHTMSISHCIILLTRAGGERIPPTSITTKKQKKNKHAHLLHQCSRKTRHKIV